jgi:hypothetical protein
MSLLITSAVRARAQKATGYSATASMRLNERMEKQASEAQHDIFLSHAFDDKELILGVALTLEDLGYKVYLDWRDDPKLDRTNVTSTTAAKLRERMRASKCLFYSTTENSSNSKWMPWELGFKDGQNTRAAILPIFATTPSSFQGQEYLGIYPYAVQEASQSQAQRLWIHRSSSVYVVFEDWLAGKEPFSRT